MDWSVVYIKGGFWLLPHTHDSEGTMNKSKNGLIPNLTESTNIQCLIL